jgi:S1-C subfamily serine protease
MSISFDCVFCGKKLRAAAEVLGKRVRCSHCNRSFVLVAPQQPTAEPAASLLPSPPPPPPPEKKKERAFRSTRLLASAFAGLALLLVASLLAITAGRRSRSDADPLQAALSTVVEIRGDKGLGSGFLYESPDLIVTNYHVVAGQEHLDVHFPNDSHVAADGFLIASPEYDVAVLHIPQPAPSGTFLRGTQQPLKPGDEVFALGSPKGLSGSVTKGVVSSYRRDKDLRAALTRTTGNTVSGHGADAVWIQTSAPISKGNSGGPLVAADGTVVGINTWQLSADDGQNLNFALAIDHIAKLRTSMPSMRVRSFAELPQTRREKDERRLTPDERNMIAWGWQSEVLGRWYAGSSFLNLPLADPSKDDETTPVERRMSELINQLRACARRTFEDVEELQRIPKQDLAIDLVQYIEDLVKLLASTSQAYTEGGNTLYATLRTGKQDAFDEWQERLLKPQREVNDLINTTGAAVKKRLESRLRKQLWLPLTFTPRGCLWLCSLEDRVSPETFSAVFTGTPRTYLFPTYYRHRKTEEAAWILQFVMKDTEKGSEPYKRAMKLLAERESDPDDSSESDSR